MIRIIIIILILLVPNFGSSQKFRIVDNDTIQYFDSTFIYCNSFEILEGNIINRITDQCNRIGYWIVFNENENISKGYYNRWGRKNGIWREFNTNDILVNKIEYASIFTDTYILKKVNYENGEAKIVSQKTQFVKFYLKHPFLIISLILGAFFIRIPINIAIIENRDEKIYSFPFNTKDYSKSIQTAGKVLFPIWWKKKVPKNKNLRTISNLLSLIAYGGFLILLVGMAISGEI